MDISQSKSIYREVSTGTVHCTMELPHVVAPCLYSSLGQVHKLAYSSCMVNGSDNNATLGYLAYSRPSFNLTTKIYAKL